MKHFLLTTIAARLRTCSEHRDRSRVLVAVEEGAGSIRTFRWWMRNHYGCSSALELCWSQLYPAPATPSALARLFFKCHGRDAKGRKAELRLDKRDAVIFHGWAGRAEAEAAVASPSWNNRGCRDTASILLRRPASMKWVPRLGWRWCTVCDPLAKRVCPC